MKQLFILIFLFLAATIAVAQHETITQESLLDKVKILTSAEFDGRLPGSEGYRKAVEYSAGVFKELGLKEINGSYKQTFYTEYNKIKAPAAFELVSGERKEYKLGKDYIFRGFTGSGNVEAEAVFCGYGISDSLYDDYKDIDLNGKVVMVFKNQPSWSIGETPFSNAYPREKAKIAADHGAIAILFLSLPNDKSPQGVIGSVMHGPGEQNESFPQLHINIDAADDILVPSGFKLKELQTRIDSLKQPYSVATGSTVHITATAEYNMAVPVENVLGLIEGSDPVLKDEYIIIGAHLDHVGSQAGEVLFPGANDNASGSAAVMEIASAFIKNNIRPARSIIFVLFACEEQGLFGSRHFVDNSPVPLDKITAMFNLDCIGYGDSIQIGNGKSAPHLWELIRSIDKNNFNLMTEDTWSGGGADAQAFHDAGIPSAYFVSRYSYVHLHLPTDNVETLNGFLFEKLTQLAFLSAVELSTGRYVREKLFDSSMSRE